MWPWASSSGTVSVKVSAPCSRRISVTGSSGARKSANSAMPPSWRNFSSTGVSRAAQVPDHQLQAGDDERGLPGPPEQALELEGRVLGEDLAVRPEPDAGAGPALRDPVALAGQPRLRGSNAAVGTVAVEDARHAAVEATGPAGTATGRRRCPSAAESALTTDRPTPCRPPVATYEPPPNLPPACSLVATTSTPGSPVLGSLSVGMPRPSSWTSTEPSGCRVTSTRWARDRPAPRPHRCR